MQKSLAMSQFFGNKLKPVLVENIKNQFFLESPHSTQLSNTKEYFLPLKLLYGTASIIIWWGVYVDGIIVNDLLSLTLKISPATDIYLGSSNKLGAYFL
jgi:hypothetical protein